MASDWMWCRSYHPVLLWPGVAWFGSAHSGAGFLTGVCLVSGSDGERGLKEGETVRLREDRSLPATQENHSLDILGLSHSVSLSSAKRLLMSVSGNGCCFRSVFTRFGGHILRNMMATALAPYGSSDTVGFHFSTGHIILTANHNNSD